MISVQMFLVEQYKSYDMHEVNVDWILILFVLIHCNIMDTCIHMHYGLLVQHIPVNIDLMHII